MQLVQLSTSWCAPCKKMKQYIESTFSDHAEKGYSFIDMEKTSDEKMQALASMLKVKSVPTFVVIKDMEILSVFGNNKEAVDRYFNDHDTVIKIEQETDPNRDANRESPKNIED